MPDRHSRCGNCAYHEPTFIWSEGVCENPESTYYKCYTDRFAYCKRFEEKEDEECCTPGMDT